MNFTKDQIKEVAHILEKDANARAPPQLSDKPLPSLPTPPDGPDMDKIDCASMRAADAHRPPRAIVLSHIAHPLVMYVRLGRRMSQWIPVCKARSRGHMQWVIGDQQAGWLDSYAFWRTFIKGLLAGHHTEIDVRLAAVRLESEAATERWTAYGGRRVKDPDGSTTIELPVEHLTQYGRDAIITDGALADVREGFWILEGDLSSEF